MKKDAYLQCTDVARFLEWAEPLVAGHTGIHVSWKSRGHRFECATLEQAYLGYSWRGRVERGNGSSETIATFEETAQNLPRMATNYARCHGAAGASEPRRSRN